MLPLAQLHPGKLNQLPHTVREKLNRRLANGELAATLLPWLNGLPRVRALLKREFGGKPINKQNLSVWRQSGYRQWVQQQETLALAERMAGDNKALQQTLKG